jgi:hypothetical protein
MDSQITKNDFRHSELLTKIKRLRNMHDTFQNELNLLEQELDSLLNNIDRRLDEEKVNSMLESIKNS